jgi:hypothetical protein
MLDGAGGDSMNPLGSAGPSNPLPPEAQSEALTTGLGRSQPSYRATSFRNVDVPPSTAAATSNYVNPVAFRQEANVLQKNRKPVLVSHQYSAACLQELSYLCQLISKIRQPLCPVNGVLSLLQYESIHSTAAESDELKKAIRADIETVHASLSLKSPITTLVVGLEKERGFCELVRRVGRDRALSQRFGRRYDVLSVPTKSDLLAFTTLACGTFEDWAYTLFREPEALSKPGNTRLYELLSKVRCAWKGKLADIIAGGYAPDQSASSNSLFYSGCYFAATGDTPDRQAFVRGVIEKLNEEQEMVEWSDDKLRAHKRHQVLATAGMIITMILILLLVFQMIWTTWFSQSASFQNDHMKIVFDAASIMESHAPWQ